MPPFPVILLMLLILPFLIVASAVLSGRGREVTVDKGRELRDEGRLQEAIHVFQTLAMQKTRAAPGRERALFELADTFDRMGNEQAARNCYMRYFQDYVLTSQAPHAPPELEAVVREKLAKLGEVGVHVPQRGETKDSYWQRHAVEYDARKTPALKIEAHPHRLDESHHKIKVEPHHQNVEPHQDPTLVKKAEPVAVDPVQLAKDERALAVGQRVGSYVLAEKLGEGGFGTVFRALRPVAIKLARDPSVVEHLRKFGTIQGHVRSERVVKPLEVNLEADPPYVVMELVEGCTLRDVLATRKLSIPEAVAILREVGLGLRDCHEQGVLHLDLKPENVLMDESGFVKLTDFDLGRMTEEAAQFRLSRSIGSVESDKVAGTIAYMSPEQRDGRVPDARSDVYTFGVLLFEALTGELPQPGDKPSDLRKEVSSEIDKIFERCFTRHERRYATIREAVLDLEGVLAHEPAPVDLAKLMREAPEARARVAARASLAPESISDRPTGQPPAKLDQVKPVVAPPERGPIVVAPVSSEPAHVRPPIEVHVAPSPDAPRVAKPERHVELG